MTTQPVVTYFRVLAALAVFLLWGISLVNGTVKALLLAVWHGKLNEKVDLKTDYTGLPIIDYPIAVLVAFFFYSTNGHDAHYQLFLLDAYATLQSAFVWLYAETARAGQKPKWVDRPVVFGLLWQCFGAAISLPLYYAAHITWMSETQVTRVRHADLARSIPLGFLLGAVLPAIIGMAPTWAGPGMRSAAQHQSILAAWQPDPLWVCFLQMALVAAVASLRGNASGSVNKDTAFRWIRTSYLLAATSSALGHMYMVGCVMAHDDPLASLIRMYVPFPSTGPTGVSDILVRGPWLFLQYDMIIISLSSLSWAFIVLARASKQQRQFSLGLLALYMLGGTVTIGPGATVSLALFVREGMLPVDAPRTEPKGRSGSKGRSG